MNYSTYVFANELCLKTGKKINQIILNKHIKNRKAKEYFGSTVLLKRDCIKSEYFGLFEDCLNPDDYRPITYLSTLLGRNQNYLTLHKDTDRLVSVKLGLLKLVKLPDVFRQKLERGMSPYLKKNNETFDDDIVVVDFYGMKVGFY